MNRKTILAAIAVLALTGCSSQSYIAKPPIGISSNINGLQQSQCACGGLERQKEFKARRKAELEAQKAQRDRDGN